MPKGQFNYEIQTTTGRTTVRGDDIEIKGGALVIFANTTYKMSPIRAFAPGEWTSFAIADQDAVDVTRYPELTKAIQSLDSRSDRHGEDLVFHVMYRLADLHPADSQYPSYLVAHQQYLGLGEAAREEYVRFVLNEPKKSDPT